MALEVSSVGIRPFSTEEPVFDPLSDVLHASCVEDVGALAVFLACQPVAGEDILVGIDEHPLARLDSRIPLSVVLTLIAIDESSDAVLEVIFELTRIDITIGVRVFPFSSPQLR